VYIPHWSEPPFATSNCILYVNDKNRILELIGT
jgi:hypothetical protein